METKEKRVVPDNDVIDLRDLYFAMKRKFLLILAVGLLGACLYGVYTALFMEPLYTSTSSILVLSKETDLTSLTDLQFGTQLTSDYQVLLKSTGVMEEVIEDLDLDVSVKQLRDSITIANPENTRILEVSVANTDAALAKEIADQVVEVFCKYIGDKMEVIPPKIIEKGKIPTVQASPSMSKNVIMGFLLGVVLCAGIICIIAIMDDSIKSEEDMEKYLGIAVLASVPDRQDYINHKKKKKKRR